MNLLHTAEFNLILIETPMAGKSASLTFRLVLRASQPITMSKMFLAASAMPWMGILPTLLTVANVVSVANSNFQLATLVLIIGNILTLATFSKTRLKIPNENMRRVQK